MRSKGKGNQIFMADRDPRTRRPAQVTLMARKSAPVSAGGINARRLERWRLAAMAAEREEEEDDDYVDEEEEDEEDEEESDDDEDDDEEEEKEEEEKEPNNQCGNPFCRQILANRYARYCEDKPLCQRYRALKLQCLANAQAEEEEEDTRPLALVIKNKKKKKEEKEKEKKKEEEPFAIPRRKKTEIGGKRRLNLNATAAPIEGKSRSNSNSPREMVKKRQKKREMDKRLEEEKEKEEKKQRKKLKRAREAAGSKGTTSVSVTSNSPSVQGSSVSSEEEFVSLADELKTRVRLRDPRTRPPPDASIEAEARAGLKKRRLSRHVSADDVLSRSASSSPGTASAAVATDTNWKIPRSKPGKKTTAVQAIRRSMNVELVPLGVPNKANLAGGGRYVQNGNRTAAPSFRPSDPRPRPPTKFVSPAPATKAPPAAPPVVASTRPMATARSSASAPPPAPTRPPPLPPLPPQAPSLPPPAPRPIEPAQMVTPSSSPVRTPAIVSNSISSNARTTTATSAAPTGPSRIKRISTSDYRKSRQDNVRGDQLPSRSSSLERSSDLPGERPSAYPAVSSPSSYTSRPEYRRSDSAPLSSSSSSSSVLRQRELGANLDPRRQYPDSEEQFRRQQPYYEGDSGRMEYQDRRTGRGEFQSNDSYSSGPGQWEGRSYPPPRDHYPPRQQEPSSFGASNGRDGGSFDYAMDTHFSPASSPPDQSYRRENQREDPPLPLRAPSPRRSEPERVNGDRRTSDFDDLDEDAPTFSYNEVFLPQLLSIFIHKFPSALDAISNVTKKPRKMNWYIKYVERIQRLCQPHDVLVKLEGTKAVVTVRGREWIALQGTSTITLYMDVLKRLQAEALTWLTLYEEMESALQHYRGMYGSQTNESYAFLRAWNDLKRPGSYISVPRQANYFCGARLHHWNFVVGKVEIGSGSHEDKREAFRLATVSALDFLLSAGRGTRRRSRPSEVKRERSSEATQPNERRQHRSSSRESYTGTTAPPNIEPAGEASAEASTASGPSSSTASTPAPVDSSASGGQPTVLNSTSSTKPQSEVSTTEPPSTAEQAIAPTERQSEPSSSPVTVEHTEEEPAVSVIPTTDSVSSSEVADAAEQSDPGEEMSISDASDPGAITPAGSPLLPTTHASSSVPLATPGSDVTVPDSTVAGSSATTSSVAFSSTTTESSVAPLPSSVPSGIAAMVAKFAAAAGVSTAPNSQSTAKTTVPARRCMMCEMIRMRKPDGERCLRCQQKDAPANGLLGSSLDP
ncbi:hypothetical protein PF008_g13634 [Phytophthora fragariae]|uniref:Uncharacterized protein n=1 Tax=Phytophthora fragariae TaxID=53985 RepID=A0A6G0RJV7_9STRA|nr:hypothetical protein PF008_g13634 [Phytophthora fragariae]